MGLGVEISTRPNNGPGVRVLGKWYPGDGASEIGASMKADGWAVKVDEQTVHATKGAESMSITCHRAGGPRAKGV